ncbi:MAG: DUF1134 domain-containing protein [Nevskia sp.]|jgi:hypothetical protein|nr:DUF1134 domain-containing protein [Nevskia sp.]MCK9385311.1 DUF1134 domain-containing protein [Nevskia sp.]
MNISKFPTLALVFAIFSGAPVAATLAQQSAPETPSAQPQEATPDDASAPQGDVPQDAYTQEETLEAAQKFFGGTSAGLAKAIEKVFSENGKPVAYIIGSEGSGAFIVGLRYGEGTLKYKNGGSTKVYWQGPSVGFDFGGNASKVFTLVYNLHWTKDLYQRFPGVDGSLYVVAGVGLNYQRANDITLAPIRTGVGLRAGANVGYLSYTRDKKINPF